MRMKKKYIKPTSQFTELRMEERLADCVPIISHAEHIPGCDEQQHWLGPDGS